MTEQLATLISFLMELNSLVHSSCFSKDFLASLHNLDKRQTRLLLRTIWPALELADSNLYGDRYKCFFSYVSAELSPLRHDKVDFAVQNFNGVRDVMLVIYEQRMQSRRQILEAVKKDYLNCDDGAILRSIELTIQICVTINIQSSDISLGPVKSNTVPIQWEDGATLEELIRAQFISSENVVLGHKDYMIEPRFTAALLASLASIKIEWTDNLAEHLQYNRNRRAVKIYEHKICLIHHLEAATSIIPQDVLTEAIDTLNLLFPFDGQETRDFLRQQGKDFYKIAHHGRIRLLDLRDYNYWRQQLLELIEASNEPAHSWWQLLKDSRNKVQYWTFWIAVIVLIFTLFDLVCGLFSSIYTYRQFELARMQACSMDPVPPALKAKFCRKLI